MDFSQKLNSLIRIAGLKNSQMAKTLNVDPSLISRWRSGTRKLACNTELMVQVASYISSHITTEHHRKLLAELLGSGLLTSASSEDITEAIYDWLNSGEAPSMPMSAVTRNPFMEPSDFVQSNAYSGWLGRKLVMERLHNQFRDGELLHSICFFSNDPVQWIHADIQFRQELLKVTPNLFDNIKQVRVIMHNNATVDEIVELIGYVLPFTHSGIIQIAQIPRYRKELFTNTILIAGEAMAAASHGFAGSSNFMTNFYTDREFIKRLTGDFDLLFRKCEPVHKVEEDITLWDDIEEQQQMLMMSRPIMYVGNAMPAVFLPAHVTQAIADRARLWPDMHPGMRDTLLDYGTYLDAFLQAQAYVLHMPLYQRSEVENGEVAVMGVPQFYDGRPVIDIALYIQMLQELQRRMRDNPNILFHPIPRIGHNHAVTIQRESQMMVKNCKPPYVGYDTSHSNLIYALDSFICARHGTLEKVRRQQDVYRGQLDAHIDKLLADNAAE